MDSQKTRISLSQLSESDVGSTSVCVIPAKRRRPFNGRNRRVILDLLVKLQNGKCCYGFDCCNGQLTVIAHKNHNPFDDQIDNLAASCPPCNRRISNLGRSKRRRSSDHSVSVETESEQPDALAVNREKEPQWIDYYTRRLDEEIEIYQRILSAEAINYCNISIETDRKYRVKWVAPADYKGPANFLFEAYREKDSGKTVLRLRKLRK